MKTRFRVALPATLVAVSLSFTACGGDKAPSAKAPATTASVAASTPSGSAPAGSTPVVPEGNVDSTIKCLSKQGFVVHQINVHRIRLHFGHSKPVIVRFFDTPAAAAAVAPPALARKDGTFSDLGWTLLNNVLIHGKGYLHPASAVDTLTTCLTAG